MVKYTHKHVSKSARLCKYLLSVIHVNQTTKERKSHFCNFNKKKYIFNLHSEEYVAFLYI